MTPGSKEFVTCRRVLNLMVISGFMVNAILKTILNIAIVAMVRKDNQTETGDQFDWTEDQKQNILGVFFWGFALTKIPSGRLAEVIGPRKVTGYSMGLAALLTLLTPWIAFFNYYAFLVSRVAMGFLIGASWPAVMPLATSWIPPKDQSIFISCISSTGIGMALAFHFCGFLIAAFGWPSVFYATGAGALIWCVLWFYLVYDSPEQHPRISVQEKLFLMREIQGEKKKRVGKIPWVDIVKSGPVWAIAAGQISVFFGLLTVTTELPSYLDQVLHVDIEQNGLLSGLPYWGGYASSILAGYIADRMRSSGRFTTTTIRRIFESISTLIPAIFMVILAFYGNITEVALTLLTFSLSISAMSSAGHCANILDISPNYAGTICGIVNSVASFSVYFSTKIVAHLLRDGHTFQEWRNLFWILLGSYLCGAFIYTVLCSGKLQSWDSKNSEEEKNQELKLMTEKEVV